MKKRLHKRRRLAKETALPKRSHNKPQEYPTDERVIAIEAELKSGIELSASIRALIAQTPNLQGHQIWLALALAVHTLFQDTAKVMPGDPPIEFQGFDIAAQSVMKWLFDTVAMGIEKEGKFPDLTSEQKSDSAPGDQQNA